VVVDDDRDREVDDDRDREVDDDRDRVVDDDGIIKRHHYHP
jgi:hypothetical protein